MEGRLDLRVCQVFEHQPHHAEEDPRLTGRGQEFVVFAQPSIASDPRQRALDDPAVRLWVGVGEPKT
jgi:hypothetical protein